MINYLLDAVDRLTQRHITRVVQSNPQGITCTSEVDHDPLLIQLRAAVAGGIGSHAGSSSARERIPFDANALRLFDEIADQVNLWYRALAGHVEERTLQDRMRDWYIDFENRRRAGKVSDVVEHDTLKLVEGWARQIEEMFDPPTKIELVGSCPMCGERYAHDPKSGDRITAIVIEYRNLGVETLDKATGLCRFCLAVWRGPIGLRELRWAVDNPPAA